MFVHPKSAALAALKKFHDTNPLVAGISKQELRERLDLRAGEHSAVGFEHRPVGVRAPDDYAAAQAQAWKAGLAEWGQDGDRIRRLREAADFDVYTPGSSAGVPISILRSLAPPSAAIAGE